MESIVSSLITLFVILTLVIEFIKSWKDKSSEETGDVGLLEDFPEEFESWDSLEKNRVKQITPAAMEREKFKVGMLQECPRCHQSSLRRTTQKTLYHLFVTLSCPTCGWKSVVSE